MSDSEAWQDFYETLGTSVIARAMDIARLANAPVAGTLGMMICEIVEAAMAHPEWGLAMAQSLPRGRGWADETVRLHPIPRTELRNE